MISLEILILVSYLFIRSAIISYFPGAYSIYHYLKSNKNLVHERKISKIYLILGVILNLLGILITYITYTTFQIIEAWYFSNLVWFTLIVIAFIFYFKIKK